PHRKQESQNRHAHAGQHQRRIAWENFPVQPRQVKTVTKNQQKTDEDGNQMFQALSRCLTPLIRLAEKCHQQPHEHPNCPGPPANLECLVGCERKPRRRIKCARYNGSAKREVGWQQVASPTIAFSTKLFLTPRKVYTLSTGSQINDNIAHWS